MPARRAARGRIVPRFALSDWEANISKRTAITLLGALIIVLVAAGSWRMLNSRKRLQQNIGLVHEGMTEGEVVAILGHPTESKKPCYAQGAGCDRDLIYPVPFDLTGFWAISVDHSGRVIEKFYWHSP